jgi:hypothetical protein
MAQYGQILLVFFAIFTFACLPEPRVSLKISSSPDDALNTTMSSCQCDGDPTELYSTQVIFDTLALPSFPIPSQAATKARLRIIRSKIHSDKPPAVLDHCQKFGVTIKVANALYEWLITKTNTESHFQQHWIALGCLEQETSHFPWNPAGKESHDSLLPIRLGGNPVIPHEMTACEFCSTLRG